MIATNRSPRLGAFGASVPCPSSPSSERSERIEGSVARLAATLGRRQPPHLRRPGSCQRRWNAPRSVRCAPYSGHLEW